jgi:hypothetical protein
MLGTTGATVLFVVNVVFAGVLGGCAGGLVCLALRRRWTLRTGLTDAALGAAAALIAAYVVSAIGSAHGVWESRVTLIIAIAVASIVARHILRPLLHFFLR